MASRTKPTPERFGPILMCKASIKVEQGIDILTLSLARGPNHAEEIRTGDSQPISFSLALLPGQATELAAVLTRNTAIVGDLLKRPN